MGDNKCFATLMINGKEHPAMLDSGAGKSIINMNFYVDFLSHLKLDTSKSIYVQGVTTDRVKISGSVELLFQLNNYNFRHTFYVMALCPYSIILGNDWLMKHKCIIDYNENKLSIKPNVAVCFTVPLCNYADLFKDRRIVCPSYVNVPAQSEIILLGDVMIDDDFAHMSGVCGFVENDGNLTEKTYLVAASVLTRVINNKVVLRMLNPTNKDILLRPKQTLACFSPQPMICSFRLSDTPVPPERPINRPTSGVPPGTDLSNSDMTEDEKQTLLALLSDYRDCFAADMTELGHCKLGRYHIDLSDDRPCKQMPYRISPHKMKLVEHHLSELLKSHTIEESTAGWSSPVVIAAKKGTDLGRFCVDYRLCNSRSIPDAHMLPRIDDITMALGENQACLFTTLDMRSGYNQLLLDEESRDITTFTTHLGNYRYKYLPFGLTNAPGAYQSLLSHVLINLNYKVTLTYVDDVLIFASCFIQMIDRIKLVLDRIRSAGMTLHPGKCQWIKKTVTFLGHKLTADGLRPDDQKVEVVAKCPTPKNQNELRAILGLMNYYRKFVKDYSIKCAPLNALLKDEYSKESAFLKAWSPDCEHSFKILKQALITQPVLAFPDFNLPMILYTDACQSAIAGCLHQIQNGVERVIGYCGRQLRPAEKKYSVTELECLAIVYSVTYFDIFLANLEFQIVTDHRSLSWLFKVKDNNQRLMRWSLKLQSYRYTIVYRPGRLHQNADSLSRLNYADMDLTDSKSVDDSEIYEVCAAKTSLPSLPSKLTPLLFRDAQYQDTLWKPYIDYLLHGLLPTDDKAARKLVIESAIYEMFDGLLCRIIKNKRKKGIEEVTKQICVPSKYCQLILTEAHSRVTSGGAHFGYERTYSDLIDRFWWPSISKDTAEFCRTCVLCQKHKGNLKRQANLQPLPIINRPFSRISIDFVTNLPVTEPYGNKNLLVVVDSYTKFADAFPTQDMKASTVARILYNEVWLRYGPPSYLLSDKQSSLIGETIQELSNTFNVQQLQTSPYHPQTDGQCERMNKTLMTSLSMFCDVNQKDWDSHIRSVIWAYNTGNAIDSTCHCPFFLLYARHAPLATDLNINFDRDYSNMSPANFAEAAAERLKCAYKCVDLALQAAEQKRKKHYDKHVHQRSYDTGDIVYLRVGQVKPGLSRKLAPKWEGPYHIANVMPNKVNVRLRRCSDNTLLSNVVHINRLKPGFIKSHKYTMNDTRVDNQGKKDNISDTPSIPDKVVNEMKRPGPIDGTDYWEVKKILSSFYDRKTGKRWYKCWWKGWTLDMK